MIETISFWRRTLIRQQCWCCAQDARHPFGNRLAEFGFTPVPPPLGTGSVRYQLRLSARATITIWDFGLYYARCGRGGLFLDREGNLSLRHQAGFLETVWTPDTLPLEQASTSTSSDSVYLMAKAAEWLSRYESRVLDRYGLPYRRACLQTWNEPAILPQLVPEEWQRLWQRSRP